MFASLTCVRSTSTATVQPSATRASKLSAVVLTTSSATGETNNTTPGTTGAIISVASTSYVPGASGPSFFFVGAFAFGLFGVASVLIGPLIATIVWSAAKVALCTCGVGDEAGVAVVCANVCAELTRASVGALASLAADLRAACLSSSCLAGGRSAKF